MNISKIKNLFGFDNNINELINLYKNKKLPNKIIFSGECGIGKSILVFHLINYILSEDELNSYDIKNYKILSTNKTFKLISKNAHPNLYFLEKEVDKKYIEISQIRELKNFIYKSSLLNKPKIVFINNVENLSISSSNAILKIIEEDKDNIFFFLVYSKNKFLLDTVKSRCVEYNLFLNSKFISVIIDDYFKKEIYNLIPNEFKNVYMTPSSFINLIKFCDNFNLNIATINIDQIVKIILNDNLYRTQKLSFDEIKLYIELYFYNKLRTKKNENQMKFYNYFNKKFYNAVRYNMDLYSIFLEFQKNFVLYDWFPLSSRSRTIV